MFREQELGLKKAAEVTPLVWGGEEQHTPLGISLKNIFSCYQTNYALYDSNRQLQCDPLVFPQD